MQGTTRLPYLLDTEATSSIIPEAVFDKLTAQVQMTLETLDQPIRIVQADGSTILVNGLPTSARYWRPKQVHITWGKGRSGYWVRVAN